MFLENHVDLKNSGGTQARFSKKKEKGKPENLSLFDSEFYGGFRCGDKYASF